MDPGLLEIPTGAVIHRNPTDDIDAVAFLGRDEIVARLPGKPSGDVAQLGLCFRRSGGLDFPLEAGLENGVVAERWKFRFPGQTELDFPIDLHHRFSSASGSAVSGTQDFCLNQAIGFLGLANRKINRLPLEEREQVGLSERVVAVVLLENLQRLSALVAKHDGVRFELQRRTVVLDGIQSLL